MKRILCYILFVFAIAVTVTAQYGDYTRSKSTTTESIKKAPAPKKDNTDVKKKAAEAAAKKKAAEAAKKRQQEAAAKKKGSQSAAKVTTHSRRDRSGKDEYGREYVDLGLPGGVLWATCNVGASSPWQYGLYFALGETMGYAKGESHSFDWPYYKWCNGRHDSMTKYCTSSSYGRVDNKTVLDPEDDAATANWGSGWRMPTLQEIKDLFDSKYTTTEWVTVNGVNGRKITSKSNGNSIFLPAAGFRYGTSLFDEGSYGNYWSSSLSTDFSLVAYGLGFNSSGIDWRDYYRNGGQSVRAVRVGSE